MELFNSKVSGRMEKSIIIETIKVEQEEGDEKSEEKKSDSAPNSRKLLCKAESHFNYPTLIDRELN